MFLNKTIKKGEVFLWSDFRIRVNVFQVSRRASAYPSPVSHPVIPDLNIESIWFFYPFPDSFDILFVVLLIQNSDELLSGHLIVEAKAK